MSVWTVTGGRALSGSVRVQGSKNAALPVLAACVLVRGVTLLENCPCLSDVDCAVSILRELGCRVQQQDGGLLIDARGELRSCIPLSLMERMRSSALFLGALLGRNGEAEGFQPGGCSLGERPIDYHLLAFRALGARVSEQGSEILCRADALQGAVITLPGKSVGATENALLAACGAKGESVIRNAAAEPEILCLCAFLRAAGAEIEGEGSNTIRVRGFSSREQVRFRIPSDRIASASYLCFALASRGEITLLDCPVSELRPVLQQLGALGAEVREGANTLTLRMPRRPRGSLSVSSGPYPLFPTDAMPLLLAVCASAEGESTFRENIFSDRLRYVPALQAMGADIRADRREAAVRGVERLHGAAVEGTDLRGSAALLCAALGAEGESVIRDAGHLERGYERADALLRQLGAEIKKE
ncbi:MAG: UDP-N-acetylglucosamine 1-carboxyvinyltransferase [Oscillospiraceae bacterium]|nr:UDP-N-acetylglucosamine 1-carboxyvinyltransferase [Oscillospiraceae bacterium]